MHFITIFQCSLHIIMYKSENKVSWLTSAVRLISDVDVPDVDDTHTVCRIHLQAIIVIKTDGVDVTMVILYLLAQLQT